jgi:hypothetical protein
MSTRIVGMEHLSTQELLRDIQAGGRFVIYTTVMSFLVITMRNPSDIHYVPAGQSALVKGLPYAGLTLLLGWWGIPWGFIYTPIHLIGNLLGGRDVTSEVLESFKTGG